MLVVVWSLKSLRRQCRSYCVRPSMVSVAFIALTSRVNTGPKGVTTYPQAIAVISEGFNRRIQLSVHVTEGRILSPANLHRS